MDGVLLIDKPAGMTSHDVVAAVRRSLGGARTGHAGTLDPFATGLLLVLVGRATKAQRALMELPKRYQTVARLGAVSSTGDTEGEITETGRLPPDPPELPTGDDTPAPADPLGGEDRRRARLPARSSRRALRDARAGRHGLSLRAALARGGSDPDPRPPAGPSGSGSARPPRRPMRSNVARAPTCAR